MKQLELTIEGMSCNHCVMAVKKELAKISGVTIEKVEVGKAIIQYDDSTVQQNVIAQAIDEAGFKLVS